MSILIRYLELILIKNKLSFPYIIFKYKIEGRGNKIYIISKLNKYNIKKFI